MSLHRARPEAGPAPLAMAAEGTAPEDLAAAAGVLRSGWLTMGPRTLELEAECARRFGAPHAVACAGATAALHLAFLALGVGPGDEIIVPGLGGVAAAAAARRCDATPVPADVGGPADPTIDVRDALARAGTRAKAVVAVHLAGLRARVAELRGRCADRGVAVVEHAPGGAGTAVAGDVACAGLLPGGAAGGEAAAVLLTGDGAVASAARSRRSHAMTAGTWARHTGAADAYDVEALGFNYRIDELRSVLALGRLGRADAEAGVRRALARAYRDGLAGAAGVLPPSAAVRDGDWHAFPIALEDPAQRGELCAALAARGIATALPDALWGAPPRAAAAAAALVLLPLHAGMDGGDVARACLAVREELGG